MSHSSTSSSDRTNHDGLVTVTDRLPAEVGARLAAQLAVAVFIATVVGTVLVDLVAPAPEVKLLGVEARREEKLAASARFLDGSLAKSVERSLRRRSRVRREVVDRWARVLYQRLRWVKDPVVCGSDGWLFLQNRITVGGGSPEWTSRWSGAVLAAVDRRFASIGHDLLVVPIPRKSATVPERLPRGWDARVALDGLVIEELERRRLNVVDLRPAFARLGDRAYHMLGSHWADEAQFDAALAVTRSLGDPVEDPTLGLTWREGVRGADTDLLRMVGVVRPYEPPAGAARRTIDTVPGADVLRPPKRPAATDLVVLGSSFTQGRSFPSYLSLASGRRVWNGARSGTTPDEVMAGFADLGSRAPMVVLEAPMHHFLDRPHLKFADALFSRTSPHGVHCLRRAAGDEAQMAWHEDIAVSDERLVARLAQGTVAHTGDGVFAVRIRGRVSQPVRVVVRAEGVGQVGYLWHPERTDLVLPILDVRSDTRGVSVTMEPSATNRATVNLEAVEWVVEVSPRRFAHLAVARTIASGSGWRAICQVRSPQVVGRDGAVVVELDLEGGGFDGNVQVVVRARDRSQPLIARYRDVRRGALLVTSLRPLAGSMIDTVEIRGAGPAPENVLGRGSVRFGTLQRDGLHLDRCPERQGADLEG